MLRFVTACALLILFVALLIYLINALVESYKEKQHVEALGGALEYIYEQREQVVCASMKK